MRTHQSKFHVATKHEQPLLGFHACRALELPSVVEENICEVQAAPANASSSTACITETDIVAEYHDLFEGLLEGDVHLETDPTVPPVQMPLRRLPIGIRDKVAAELQKMEANGIIAPVTEASSWVE